MSDHDSVLYALPPCTMHPIDARGLLLIRADTGAVAAVDARWQPFLGLLQQFRTLSEHAAAIVAAVPDLAGQEAALTEALGQLVPRGLWRSSLEVSAQLRAIGEDHGSLPLTVCIRTRDRPDLLRQLLASLRDNRFRHGGDWRYELFDDSRQPDSVAANRALLAEFGEHLAVAYVGRAEQDALLQRLIAAWPEDAESLRWLLDAEHPQHRERATHGLMYNHILLRHAGQRVLLLDDDATLSAWLLPNASWLPRFGGVPGIGLAYLKPEHAFANLLALDRDPLALHAQALGAPVPEAAERIAGAPFGNASFRDSAFANTLHPFAPGARVRYTLNGFLGDTGTVGDHDLLLQIPGAIPQALGSDERYRQLRAAPRCACTAAPWALLTNSSYFHHTTCAGLDLGDPLPPLPPTGRGEDTLLGALLRYLYPHDFGLRLPFALEHRPLAARPWEFTPERSVSDLEEPAMLEAWVNGLRAPAEVAPPERLRLLGESLLAMDSAGELPARLAALTATRLHQGLARDVAHAQAVLAQHPNACAAWRQDVTTLRDHALRRLQTAQAPGAGAMEALALSLTQYARCLPVWQRAWGQATA